jgi:membrane-bound serine protease (ClpP class)
MILLLSVLLATFVVRWPWSLVIVSVGVVVEVGEVVWGRRLAKRWRPRTGPEAMIGKRAKVVSTCRPDGQVRVQGELWEASCALGADIGDKVRIEALEGLTLVVVPQSSGETAGSAATPPAV